MGLHILLLVFATLLGTLVQTHSNNRFKSYNSEAREKFLFENLEKLNEIDSVDELWQGNINNQPNTFPQRTEANLQYVPTWQSLDSRPLPSWFDQNKIGIFIHWGVFSVPGVSSEWFWNRWKSGNQEVNDFMNRNYKPNVTYQEFSPEFTAEFYDPAKWANLFKKSGARYVVLTSKHHEGYTLWPSKYSFSWNSQDVGPHRDLLGELAKAVRNVTGLKFGLYHSLLEWYNPLYMQDSHNNFTTNDFVKFKTLPELYELVNTYKPEVVWSDGEWEAPSTYWQAKEFLTWLYNDSPVKDTVVTNDRWGHDTMCKHGGYYTCVDRYNPGTLQPHKWENCFTLDKLSWGYRRNAQIEDYITPEELITTIVESVSCGGNVLINVGPTREGIIVPIQEERLLQMGEWLEINGEAIYDSVPYTYQNDTITPGVWYTMSSDKTKIYGFMTSWPGNNVTIGAISGSPGLSVTMLGSSQTLSWSKAKQGIVVNLINREITQSKWVWTLQFSQ